MKKFIYRLHFEGRQEVIETSTRLDEKLTKHLVTTNGLEEGLSLMLGVDGWDYIKAENIFLDEEPEYTPQEIKDILVSIKQTIEDECTSMGELVFLENHQEEVKKYFPDDQEMWQAASISEEEWSAKQR